MMINVDLLSLSLERAINYDETFDFKENLNNAKDYFLYNAGIRLLEINSLYKKNKKYYEDFLSCLRNYLISSESSLKIDGLSIDKFKEYGLYEEKGRLYCFKTFPRYVNQDFVREAYLFEYSENKQKHIVNNNLCTDTFIKSLTGYQNFKSQSQKLSVYGGLNTPDGYTTLISIPTGGGKSLVTQTIAYQKMGLTIVVVPTVSLSIDQERVSKKVIKRKEVNKEIFSYSSGVNVNPIIDAINNKTARMLFISPEALMLNSAFKEAIKKANSQKYLKNIVVDEAHIVADWGALFRVDYQCLESWRHDLMVTNPAIRTILLSATFDDQSVPVLKKLFSENEKWIEVRCDALRKEPRYIFVKAKGNVDKKRKIMEMVKTLPHPMIVYVSSPDDAEGLKEYLGKEGINNVFTFTGRTNNSKRNELIHNWVENKFEIMVATSAFGVGVNKNDIRTVIHSYVPQNPNAYYQELGRGGRDGLPCLSVMCINPIDDENSAFQKIAKRVMTCDKICKRWIAMYNNPRSIRKSDYVIIDTSISPDYLGENEDDSLESIHTLDANMNWNIYVLLFLRRNGLFSIKSIGIDRGVYKFQIDNISSILKITNYQNSDAEKYISKFRDKEYNQYVGGFNLLKKSIKENGKKCWSEMFFDTYSCVDEYCGGCQNHEYKIESGISKFPLKYSLKMPVNNVSDKFQKLFNGTKDIIFEVSVEEERCQLLKHLLSKKVNVIVSEKSLFTYVNCNMESTISLVVNRRDLSELISHEDNFYVSGTMVVLYPAETEEIKKYMKLFTSKRYVLKNTSIIHIVPKDLYYESFEKKYSDMIDGPVMNISAVDV